MHKHLGTLQPPDSPNANAADVTPSTFCPLSPSKLPFVGVEKVGRCLLWSGKEEIRIFVTHFWWWLSSSRADWLEHNRLTVGACIYQWGPAPRRCLTPAGLWSPQLPFHSVTQDNLQLQSGDKWLNLMKVPWAAIQGFHRNAPSCSWTIRASVFWKPERRATRRLAERLASERDGYADVSHICKFLIRNQ